MATLIYSMCSSSSGDGGALTKSSSFPACSRPPQRPTTIHIRRSTSHVAQARRGLSSRTRRLEKRDKKGGGATTMKEDEDEEIIEEEAAVSFTAVDIGGGGEMEYSTEPMPKLEGLEPDFWEGPQWNALGFFVQYLWAFGILFGLIACGVAVSTYNEGATDFKQTTPYKESIKSRGLLEEEPDTSAADVFEANPTESAPSLD